ncbi:NapC/NirT family cytochrome c [Bradyrhizobium sp.]|uniref:NapC/NirT family cytochrome c n=1 Tax=Bradyrhizobium sp. TaxID=376 RepID=UPI00238798C2|nr:NapC/NirT family cytochrome c [Bradyrhizobium sp.]MDE2379447.1 NapC/NirT family cytochrome c [Bradyrhizobium sp.]
MQDTNSSAATAAPRPGFVGRLWRWFFSPTARYAWGVIIVVGFVAGVVFWGGFNWAMEMTNTEQFCVSCHEMKDNVYLEYRNTVHYSNRTGVRASCPDCHVPKEWGHKVVRKIQASNELLHKMLGSIDTQEKFNAHRLALARSVWRGMKTTDSRECRNCHKFDHMEYSVQEPRASKLHQTAFAEGKTCIDCHQGIAHKLPPKAREEYRDMLEHIDEVGPTQRLIDFLQDANVAKAKAAR